MLLCRSDFKSIYWFYLFVQVSDRLWRELGFTLVCLIQFIFVQIAICICPNCNLYLSYSIYICPNFQFVKIEFEFVFVPIAICICPNWNYICPNWKFYSSKLKILFVQIDKFICSNWTLHLSKLKIVFVQIAKGICIFFYYICTNYE